VVHGDGSFGLNALELDTAVRHNIPILVVVSLNGGWTADPGTLADTKSSDDELSLLQHFIQCRP
jgi:hypothetical protein